MKHKDAKPGTKVVHTMSGWAGIVVRQLPGYHVRVRWTDTQGKPTFGSDTASILATYLKEQTND